MSDPHRDGHRVHGRMSDAADHRRRVAADSTYLEGLAERLAEQAGLPLGLAVRRVKALAVSATRAPNREDGQ